MAENDTCSECGSKLRRESGEWALIETSGNRIVLHTEATATSALVVRALVCTNSSCRAVKLFEA